MRLTLPGTQRVGAIVSCTLALLGRSVSAQQRPDSMRSPTKFTQPALIDTTWKLFGHERIPRGHGASVGVIDSAALASPTAYTLSELLAARVPGVSVLRSSGAVGTGSRVQLRGARGLSAPREPIVIIDGVRVDAAQNPPGVSVGGQQPSRLDDIPLDQIVHIDVLRGPAASALYGTDGAGGVILITTRTPTAGPMSWSAFAEGGAAMGATSYPTNFGTGSGISGDDFCTRAESVAGSCTPGPLLSWNPLERASPFRTSTRASLGASVSGGGSHLAYLAAGSVADEQGVLAPNDLRRATGRLNVDAEPVRSLRVALRTSYLTGRTTLPVADAIIGTLAGGLTGNAVDDPVNRGYRVYPLSRFRDVPTDKRVHRALGSLAATWNPVGWLSAHATAGGESIRRDDARSADIDAVPGGGLVRVEGANGRDTRTTLSASTTASFGTTKTLASETTVGVERSGLTTRRADSTSAVDNGVPVSLNLLTTRTTSRFTGMFVSERVAWRDRRYVGFGVRRDDRWRSALDPGVYWSADAAWVISAEPFFPRLGVLSSLRLRSAYGRSTDLRGYGLGPGAPFPPIPVTPVTPGQPGAGRLRGEAITEIEAGLDAHIGDRTWVEATWYRQHSGNALTEPGCFDFCVTSEGAWRTTGLDAAIALDLVHTLRVDWTARLTASAFTNRVERLAPGQREQNVAPTALPAVRLRNVIGHPIAGIWGNRVRARDANADGIISANELEIATAPTLLGSSIPSREIGLSTNLSLRRLEFDVLVDYRGGFRKLNVTEDFRCEVELCGALYDPGASLGDQARAIAVDRAGAGFVENASFLRVREVSASWTLVPGWTYRHGVGRLALTVAGRNLLTVTPYTGLDPEVSYTGQSGFGGAEFLTQPIPRTFLLRLDWWR